MIASTTLDLIRQTEQDMRSVMLNTERCDRELAELSVRKLYLSAGRKPPATFVWLQSPADAASAAMLCAWMEAGRHQMNGQQINAADSESQTLLEDLTPSAVQDDLFPLTNHWRSWLANLDLNESSICYVRNILRNNNLPADHPIYRDEIDRLSRSASAIRTAVERSVRRYLSLQFRDKSPIQFFTETIELLSSNSDNSPAFLSELNRTTTMLDRLAERDQKFVRSCLTSFVYIGTENFSSGALKFLCGQHDADRACQLLFAKLMGAAECEHAEQVMEVTRTCGWWCPFASVCLMIDRPVEIHFDQRSMLHNTEGPSCLYEDGFGFFSLRGVSVPDWIAKGQFDLKQIIECVNAEWRRVMIDRYGIERYLKESNATMVSHDQFGRLYQISLGLGEQPLMMVEVTNSTPEPDGTFKKYFLRVPPTMTSAREAVAWTFGMENDYNPAVES